MTGVMPDITLHLPRTLRHHYTVTADWYKITDLLLGYGGTCVNNWLEVVA